jgi:hypothetical protein
MAGFTFAKFSAFGIKALFFWEDADWYAVPISYGPRSRKYQKCGEEKAMALGFLSKEHTKGTIDYAQGEIETMIRQLRIEGADVAVVVVELRRLADFVSAQADNLPFTWPDLVTRILLSISKI